MASAARQTDSSTQAGEAREACDAQASAPGAQEEIRGEDMVGKAFSIPRPPTAGHAWKIKALQYRENSGRTPNTPNPRLPIDMDSFSGLESFVRAADLLSFAEAGRALGISASAVGKNVARLEQQLGLRLFQRTTRQVRLTQEGALFHERCRRILDELHDARAAMQAAAEAPRGRLRVSLPTIGYRFLLPVLPEFQALYPEIDLDLDFNDHLVDVVEAGLDVVIRSGELADSRLVARRLGPFRFILAGSPAYLAERGMPQSPADLARHSCLRYRFLGSGKLEEWVLPGLPPHLPVALVCNNMEAMLGAAVAGMGLAYMPDFLARDALGRGELQRVLAEDLTHTGQFSALWASSRQLSPKVRAFVDFVGERLFKES
jgi:DNA-binding transcriptional LysR family regulator